MTKEDILDEVLSNRFGEIEREECLEAMDKYAKEILLIALSKKAEVCLGVLVDNNGTYDSIDQYIDSLNKKP